MNPYITELQAYPFEKLNALKSSVSAPSDKSHIALSIGEPKHAPPQFVVGVLSDNLSSIGQYPLTKGLVSLRETIARWATQRFQLRQDSLSAEHNVVPVNGTREALFSFIQATVDDKQLPARVLMPNPFYQIYEGATILAGAQPYFLACHKHHDYQMDFDSVPTDVWQQCQCLFVCSPGNPTGKVLSIETLQRLIHLAQEHDFILASDECYSELYHDENNPPPGLLQACTSLGIHDYSRCVVFHSLSKRSNLPGLRSGFVAGDSKLMEAFLKYRTYHGCAMPIYAQHASIAAWNDEHHVAENRALYREKFSAVLEILGDTLPVEKPEAGFYLWPQTPISDTDFARGLFASENVTVLPGSYLARDFQGENPGLNHVRMALVAPIEECVEAAHRIKRYCHSLT